MEGEVRIDMLEIFRQIYISGLLFQEIIHGVFALPFAVLLWKKTKSYKKVLALFLVTYLMDLDHLVDYFSYYGFEFNVSEFLGAEYFKMSKRAFTPLHAWEWIVILGVISYKKGWNSIFTIFFLAMLPHVIWDSIVVGSVFKYSIIYRFLVGFVVG